MPEIKTPPWWHGKFESEQAVREYQNLGSLKSGRQMVISRAHNWMQALPLRDSILVCVDCGERRPIRFDNWKPCRRKGESPTSGYGGVVIEMLTGKIIGRMNQAGPYKIFRYREMSQRETPPPWQAALTA